MIRLVQTPQQIHAKPLPKDTPTEDNRVFTLERPSVNTRVLSPPIGVVRVRRYVPVRHDEIHGFACHIDNAFLNGFRQKLKNTEAQPKCLALENVHVSFQRALRASNFSLYFSRQGRLGYLL
jgi:hypothetical protein